MADIDTRLAAALKRHRGGDLAGAMAAYRSLLAEAPAHAETLHLLGVATLQSGDADAAAALIERAIAAAPGVAKYYVNLGEARRSAGATEAAIDCYRRALALDPANLAARNNLGATLVSLDRLPEAREALEMAAQLSPSDAQVQINLGQVRWRQGEVVPALQSIANAVLLQPQNLAYRQLLVRVARNMTSTDLPPVVWKQLLDCFGTAGVDLQPLARPVLAVARRTPAFRDVQALAAGTPEAARAALDEGTGAELLNSLLLSDVLFHTVVPDPTTETLLVRLRRVLLAEALDEARDPESGLLASQPLFAAGLAAQAHATDFLWPASVEEHAAVDRIAHRLAQDAVTGRLTAGDKLALQRLMLVATFRPLWGPGAESVRGVAGVIELAADRFAPRLRLLVRRQIVEPKQEETLAAGLRRLAPDAVVDERPGVSAARWQTLNKLPPVTLAQRAAALFPALAVRPSAGRALVAGCGMGKAAIELAAQLADTRVLAIDRCRRDLAYAQRMARAQAVPGIAFRLGGGADLAGDGGQFDLIEAMVATDEVPVLAAALAPGGLIKLVLPSEHRAALLAAARGRIADDPASLADLSVARLRLLALPADDPARAVVGWDGFYARPSAETMLYGPPVPGVALDAARALVNSAGLQWLGLQRDHRIVADLQPNDLTLQVWARKPG